MMADIEDTMVPAVKEAEEPLLPPPPSASSSPPAANSNAPAPASGTGGAGGGGGGAATVRLTGGHTKVVEGKKMPGLSRGAADDVKLEGVVREMATRTFETKGDFTKLLGRLKRKQHLIVKNSEFRRVYDTMLAEGRIDAHEQMALFLRTKGGKSASGILSVTVFTSPYPQYVDPKTGKLKKQKFTCAWNCYFCPDHPDHPRSYLPDEPGCLRAERCGFDPMVQMWERLETLRCIGHPVDKLEVLVLGGTWESYPRAYQTEYVRDLFFAANTFFECSPKGFKGGSRGREHAEAAAGSRKPQSLEEEQILNESAMCKIIGLTLETRPDTVNLESIRDFRRLGCTRLVAWRDGRAWRVCVAPPDSRLACTP